MATIARPRESVKNVKDDFFDPQPPKVTTTGVKGGMGKAKPVISDEQIKNANQYAGARDVEKAGDQGAASDEPSAPSTGDKPRDTTVEADREGSGKTVSLVEQEENRRREIFSELKRKAINQGAEEILSCLEPRFAQEFRIAAMEFGVKDIGIYILGILNRLAKEVDYSNPDFEVEWEAGVVGYTDTLYCSYCSKEITNPTKLKQKFCSNLCAKYYREQDRTGVIYPDETAPNTPSEEEQERIAFEAEQKRTGGD